MKKTNKANAVEAQLPKQPGVLLWRRLGIIAFICAAVAGAIYAFKVGTERTSDGRANSHAADHRGSHADHHAATNPMTREAASAAAAKINNTPPPGSAPEGMVWVPGGTFWMGCENCEMPDALPVHLVEVDGFWMDKTPITNR